MLKCYSELCIFVWEMFDFFIQNSVFFYLLCYFFVYSVHLKKKKKGQFVEKIEHKNRGEKNRGKIEDNV